MNQPSIKVQLKQARQALACALKSTDGARAAKSAATIALDNAMGTEWKLRRTIDELEAELAAQREEEQR